jgi:hypothetical protein
MLPLILLSRGWSTRAVQLYRVPVFASVFLWMLDQLKATCGMATISRPDNNGFFSLRGHLKSMVYNNQLQSIAAL